MMILSLALLSFSGILGFAHAQAYETADFDVTRALENLDIVVSEIPVGTRLTPHRLPKCSALGLLYREGSLLTPDQETYVDFIASYWSQLQNEVSPQCIFLPSTTNEVAAAVLISRLTQCPFAVKSGGHAAFAGASNADRGITISLSRLNDIKLSNKGKRVTIGPGNRWADVYKKLDPLDVTVAGGRVSSVGTGGLTLGGGISFLSNLYGWACDNVIEYQVVTAAGYITEASSKSEPELYWALRGGGNNFGIVTAFTFETLPLPKGEMWGGTKTYLEPSFNAVTEAFADLIESSPDDPNARVWVAWLQQGGMKLAATELWYAKPNGTNAAIFDGFNAIPPIADSTKTRVLHEYTDAQDDSNPYGLREVYYGLTVKADAKLATIARDVFFEELSSTEEVAGAIPVLIFQGITGGQITHMRKRGGNPLGIKPADGPLYIIHIASWWNKKSDDHTIYAFASKVLGRIKSESVKGGLASDYIYMNYASTFENVIAGYGSDNVARLKEISSLYDPAGVFQKLQPGGFKLDRAPTPNSAYFDGN